MTEANELDRPERTRVLQEGRGSDGHRARPRRRHPATASRILMVGVSVASFFTVVAGFGLRQNSASTAVTPVPATSAVPAPTATPTIATPAPIPAPTSAATVPARAQSKTRGS